MLLVRTLKNLPMNVRHSPKPSISCPPSFTKSKMLSPSLPDSLISPEVVFRTTEYNLKKNNDVNHRVIPKVDKLNFLFKTMCNVLKLTKNAIFWFLVFEIYTVDFVLKILYFDFVWICYILKIDQNRIPKKTTFFFLKRCTMFWIWNL